jgi:hypothetical protein
MNTLTWKWELDRAVRYAISDTVASVRCRICELEKLQSEDPYSAHIRTLSAWRNYFDQLRALHQQLLALPDLETAAWIPEDLDYTAPRFMAFTTGIKDARNVLLRMMRWLKALPEGEPAREATDLRSPSELTNWRGAQRPASRNLSWAEIARDLERQAYLQQLENIFYQLTELIGPEHPNWGQTGRYQASASPAVQERRSLIGTRTE